MWSKIRRFLGWADEKVSPFAAAAEEVSLLEAADRARWEEREARWEVKRRCLGGTDAR